MNLLRSLLHRFDAFLQSADPDRLDDLHDVWPDDALEIGSGHCGHGEEPA